MSDPSSLIAVSAAVLIGVAVGGLARRWLGTLKRGARVAPGWIEVPSALVSGLGVAMTFPAGPWLLVLWIGLLGVPLTAVDLAHHRLPDAMTLPAVPLTLLIAVLDGWLTGGGSAARAVAAGFVVGTVFFALALTVPRAMGRGDAKLSVGIGIALGYLSWTAVVVGVFLAFVIGSLIGLAGMLTRRLTLTSSIAFGPALLIGCWLTLVVPAGLQAVSRASG